MHPKAFFTFVMLWICLGGILPAKAQDRAVPSSAPQIQLSFAPLVRQLTPAVVNIYTKRVVTRAVNPFVNDPFFAPFFEGGGGATRKKVERSLGSGVIVEETGLVVTNAHVVSDASEIMVVLSDGREFEASLKLADKASDLALLQMDLKGESVPAAPLGNEETLQVGDLVIAIGNPFGVGQTVTSGIVSALGRSSMAINEYNFFIQTDAAINPGNSGGPLIAMDGRVVGINAAIYSRDGGSLGIGFAIPAGMVRSVMDAARQGQTSAQGGVARAWMGVQAQDMTAEIATSLGIKTPHGALVAGLHDQSPLKAAGLKVGDVITHLNGKPVQDGAELRYRSATAPLGSTMIFGILRAGESLEVPVKASLPPEIPPRNTTTVKGNGLLSGITVVNINPAVIAEHNLSEESQGVLVMAISARALAARVLHPGDILVEINGTKIKSAEDVPAAAQAPGPRGFALSFLRGGQLQTVLVR